MAVKTKAPYAETNEGRAARAAAAVYAYRNHYRQRAADEADARDLLNDLLHYMKSQGKDVKSEVRMAVGNFDAELLEDE